MYQLDCTVKRPSWTWDHLEIMDLLSKSVVTCLPYFQFYFIGTNLVLSNFSPEKLAPDACPKAKNRKRFDPARSSALSVLLDQEKGCFYPPGLNYPPSAEANFEEDAKAGPGT